MRQSNKLAVGDSHRVLVFYTGKPTKGAPEVVDCAVEDRDRETENSKVCPWTQDTRFIQVRAAKVADPTSCLGDQVWRPALGVGLVEMAG
jgi:hypothetical protein